MTTTGTKHFNITLAALIALASLAGAACASGGDDRQPNQNAARASGADNSNTPARAEISQAAPAIVPATPAAPQEQPKAQAVEKARKADSSLPTPVEPRVDGTWMSPIGRIVLKQNGTTVTGTVHYKDGSGTGTIKGKMEGRRLTFSANDNSGRTTHSARGEARFSKDGSKLIGTVRVDALGLEQPFVLTK